MNADVDPVLRAEVGDVLIRYATGIDRRDWDAFRSCFTDNCEADYGDIGVWHSAEAITTWMREVHEQCGYTMHRITNQAVKPSANGVVARSYVDAIVLGPENKTGAHSVGFYDDELVATDDGWKIARRRFTMVLLHAVPEAQPLVLEP
jgi:3-phenylpropionate/cinnamic acid dioxygenase small subunit